MAPTAAVNRPTDVKQKEADVNNKLQLYGIYSAFANGKVPSNKQIDVALNSFIASKPLASPSKRLSPEGQKLIGDVRDVVEQAKLLLLTKNDGNLIQDFIWQTQLVNGGDAKVPGAPVDKDTAKQHGNEALEGLRTLGTLIISNGQFRKLLSDAQILFRDMLGDAAQNAANRINPDEHQLNQIDRPAEDNTWHDVPDLSRQNLKSQAQGKWNEQKPFGREEVKKAAGDASEAAHPEGSRDPTATADLAAREQQYGQPQGIDAGRGAGAAFDTLRNAAEENVPEETKEKQRKLADKSRDYWGKKMPKERREQTIWRLKKMVVEIQGHEDYLRAIDTLLNLAEQYSGHTKNVAQQSHGAVKGAHKDDSLQNAEADLRTLIERFANNTSLEDLFDSINQIYRDADRDEELRRWFREMDTYVRRCLKEQGYIMQDASTDEWNRLYDQGRYLLREKYRSHTDHILDEFKFIGNQFDADAQNKAFADSLTKLFTDLGQDEEGNAKFKPHLIKDLTDVILPSVFESIRYVPIPRIEYTDPQIDAIIENLVIESDNLAPNVFEFGSDNYWRWGRKKISSKSKNKVMLSVSGIQMDLRDVSYYIKRKQGSPKLTDQGVADFFLGGNGLSFKVEMEATEKDGKRTHFFKVNKVDVDIKNISIKLQKSKHKLLFTIFRPLLLKLMKPALTKVIEKQIRDNLNKLDAILLSVQEEVNRAEADLKKNPNPENAQNIYQRYASAINKQIMQGRKKAEEVKAATEDKKVNVAVTQHDSMFKNIALPGGISTKATEFKDLAVKGDKWESPVFSIGSAGETKSLPKIPSVTRKPHKTTTPQLPPSNAAGSVGGVNQSGYGQSDYGNSGYGQPSYAQGTTREVPFNGGNYDQGNYNQGGYSQGGYQGSNNQIPPNPAGYVQAVPLPDQRTQNAGAYDQGVYNHGNGGLNNQARALGEQMDKSLGINGNTHSAPLNQNTNPTNPNGVAAVQGGYAS